MQFGSFWLMLLQPCVDWWCRLHWPMHWYCAVGHHRAWHSGIPCSCGVKRTINHPLLPPWHQEPKAFHSKNMALPSMQLSRECPQTSARRMDNWADGWVQAWTTACDVPEDLESGRCNISFIESLSWTVVW